MKLIVPGGAGFVGRNLVRILKTNGFDMDEVTILDKNERGMESVKRYGPKVLSVDLADEGPWGEEFKGKDVVINLAAQISSTEPDLFHRNNIEAIENVLGYASDNGVDKIIYFSSAAVLSARKDEYARTKLEGEELVKRSGLDYCILRPSIMYGPTDDKNIGFLIEFARRYPFFPVPGHGRWPRQPVYVDDICHVVLSILREFPCNKVYGINGRETIFFRDMVKTVLELQDGFRFRLFLPVSLFGLLMTGYQKLSGVTQFTLDQIDSLVAGEKFPDFPWWDEFEIEPTTFQNGLRRMLDLSEAPV